MLRYHFPFDGKRYIGDNRTRIVHDSLKEPLPITLNGCGIERIPYEEVRTFSPDTGGEACRRGFVRCPFCRTDEMDLHE